ncbi:MAG: hypothetical protein EPO20_29795 [Betaproteobacteria bacterium]|nr:MAG: hypothetical protein EPO20_29795 [Betaproteobacteria bacterium]
MLTYDGARFCCGPTEYRKIVSSGGRQAEIYAGARRIAERYGALIRARFPKIRRRVSGYNLDELLPENGFNVARALASDEALFRAIDEGKELMAEGLVRRGEANVMHATPSTSRRCISRWKKA